MSWLWYILNRPNMAKIWKPHDRTVIFSWIDSLLDPSQLSEELTEWEQNFVESLKSQMAYKIHLSKEQEDKLEFIYAEKTR